MPIESIEETIDRQSEERQKQSDDVRLKLRSGWRNDETILLQYFNACLNKWKTYQGERTPHQLLKLYGIYKQATVGDCNEPEPVNLKSAIGMKWEHWHAMR
jgi:acyl-CoA-binding protein